MCVLCVVFVCVLYVYVCVYSKQATRLLRNCALLNHGHSSHSPALSGMPSIWRGLPRHIINRPMMMATMMGTAVEVLKEGGFGEAQSIFAGAHELQNCGGQRLSSTQHRGRSTHSSTHTNKQPSTPLAQPTCTHDGGLEPRGAVLITRGEEAHADGVGEDLRRGDDAC